MKALLRFGLILISASGCQRDAQPLAQPYPTENSSDAAPSEALPDPLDRYPEVDEDDGFQRDDDDGDDDDARVDEDSCKDNDFLKRGRGKGGDCADDEEDDEDD